MNLFDSIVDASFTTGQDGEYLFYPWGWLGAGYILPDYHTKQQARAFLQRYITLALPLAIIIGITALAVMVYASWWAGIAIWSGLLVGSMVVSSFVCARITRNLPTCKQRILPGEDYRRASRKLSWTQLWGLEISCLILAGLSALAVTRFLSDGHTPWFYGCGGATGVLFFLSGAVVFGYMLYAKSQPS